MLRKNVLIILAVMISHCILAQDGNNYSVTGTIKDADNGKPLQMATATLLNPGDSTMVAGGTTDANGKFTINASQGTYLLKVQFVSYETKVKSGIRLNASNPNVNVGTILLKESTKSLSEVVVEGEQSRMTMEKGKKIFNVGSDLSSSGANASDVLDNIPAVTMDMEGNISLRGSQGVRILINGRPSSMMGISGSEALRYFPANQIEKVEVITNPSAKYEAQGAGGIINIILKEEQNWGLNGTFTLEASHPRDHGASVNMNFRKKWYNIFGSYNFSIERQPGGGWREQTFNYEDTTYSLRTDREEIGAGINQNFQFGSDFYFTPNDVLKVSGVYSVGDEENYTDLTFYNYSGTRIHEDDLTSRSIRDELEEEREGDHELNINYEKTFGEEDHKLTADFQARNSLEEEDASLYETSGFENEEMDTVEYQESLNATDVIAYLGKIDYTWPFSENGEFETGFRGEYRTITNDYYVALGEEGSNNLDTLDQFTNIFNYDEEIYGAYAMYNNERGKWSYSLGLRFEYTRIKTWLDTDLEKNDRTYSNFFPSASVTYKLSKMNSIQASYSRRLDRPYFRELNPFNTFNNNRNYSTGNPQLDPEFTGAYDMGYVSNNKSSSIYIGAFYRKTVNEIENVDTVNNEGITISKPFNLASRDNIGIEARYSRELKDWWDISVSSYFYRGSTSGSAAGEDLNAQALTMNSRASMDFDVKDWFEFQINGDYRAPENEGQDTEQAMYEINLGFRKDVLNDKGNIAFSVRDVFNTDIYRSEVDGSNFSARQQFQWRYGPVFSLSLSYTLKDKDATGSEQESVF